MQILIDTNVLLRFADRNQPEHSLVWNGVHQLHNQQNELVTTFQKVEHILTFNDQDFKRYEPAGIRAIHPANIKV